MRVPTNPLDFFNPRTDDERKTHSVCLSVISIVGVIVAASIPQGDTGQPATKLIIAIGCFGAAIRAIAFSVRILKEAAYQRVSEKAKAFIYANVMDAVVSGQAIIDQHYYIPQFENDEELEELSPNGDEQLEQQYQQSAPPSTEEDPIGLIAALAKFGVSANWIGSLVGASFVRCHIKLNQSLKPQRINTVKALAEDLAAELVLKYTPFISRDGGYVAIDIPRTERQILAFSDYINFHPQLVASLLIAIGVNLNGELVYADLTNTDTCHFLIGGTTGSGKTELLKAIIASIIWSYLPQQAQLIIVDPKRTKFNQFANLPWLYCPIVKDSKSAIGILADMAEEMESRYELFEANGCENIEEYLQSTGKSLPRIIVIYDEFADFMLVPADKAAIESSCKKLGPKAREAGIHLILATQRPDKDIVTPILRSNLPGRIALKVKSEGDSKILLGAGANAHHLLGRGDLLYQDASSIVRLQSLLLDDISPTKDWSKSNGGTGGNNSDRSPLTHQSSTATPPTLHQLPPPAHKGSTNFAISTTTENNTPDWAEKLLDELGGVKKANLFSGRSQAENLHLFKTMRKRGLNKTQIILVGWGITKSGTDARYQDASVMYEDMLNKINSSSQLENFLRSLPAKAYEKRQWLSHNPGVYLIFSGDCQRLFYVVRTEGDTIINLRINSSRYPHHKLANIEQSLVEGIEIYIGWIVCLQEADRIKLEDDLIRQWEPEWNNVGKI
ncbi:FtsK/SpoIIIE domain-containing protein [Aerosakkonemataceae cyanobacterium BLCC-F50]|uniref:FtsK/SpoIIIE domain-containing protein n=1 Tax=Floridaenema flaviceps BLCC-F50 TaxID=3153642 RepID=A0ABV4XVW9_9CYAN